MPIWQVLAVLISVLTLTGSILFHVFKTTWWMATLTSSLDTLTKAVMKIEERMLTFDGEYARKEDVNKDLGRIEQSIKAAHERIDKWTK